MRLSTAVSNCFSLSKAYDVFFDKGQDVKPGDKLVIGGDRYTVKDTVRTDVHP